MSFGTIGLATATNERFAVPATETLPPDKLREFIVEGTRRDPTFLQTVPAHLRQYEEWFREVVQEARRVNPDVEAPTDNGGAIAGNPLEESTTFVFENLPGHATRETCDQCGEVNMIRGTVDLRVHGIPTIRAKVCDCIGDEVFQETDSDAQQAALYRGKWL